VSPWELLICHTRSGNAWFTPFAPLTVLLSLHLHYFSTPVLHINTVFPLHHSTYIQSVSLSPSTCMDTECSPTLSSFTRECILWQWIKLIWMDHAASACVMLPLNVSCSPEYIMWSRQCHLWMRHVIVLHVIQRNTHTHASVLWNHCESPISPQSLTCSLRRVTPYPKLGVLPYLLFLTCRLQWVPIPYIWSSNRASRCPALIIIPDVLTDRLQWVLTPYICSSTRVSRYPPLLNIPAVLTCRLQ